MYELNHSILGKLRYEPGEGWWGWIALPQLAEYCSPWVDIVLDNDVHAWGPDDLPDEVVERQLEIAARQVMLDEGKLAICIIDGGSGQITEAQESSIRQLLKKETPVTKAITKEMSRQLKHVDPELLEHPEKSDDTQELTTPHLISPQSLEAQISFGDITVAADVTNGRVPIVFRGSCTWDEEHDFEVTILGGKVVDKSEISPFPCRMPAKIDLNGIPADKRGMRQAELRIYGRWSGIYEIDAARKCTGVRRPCPLCLDVAWDPSGIEFARRVPKQHRFAAVAMPVVSVFVILTAVVLSPLMLLLALTVWPGWFWGSLALCSTSLLFLVAIRFFQSHPVVWLNVVQAGLASAGLFAWYRFDAFAPVSVWEVIGWLVWGCALLASLYALLMSVLVVLKFQRAGRAVGWVIVSPFLAFTCVVGAALWFTGYGDLSRLHLIWIVPLSIVASYIIGNGVLVLTVHRVANLLDTETEALKRAVDRLNDRDHDS